MNTNNGYAIQNAQLHSAHLQNGYMAQAQQWASWAAQHPLYMSHYARNPLYYTGTSAQVARSPPRRSTFKNQPYTTQTPQNRYYYHRKRYRNSNFENGHYNDQRSTLHSQGWQVRNPFHYKRGRVEATENEPQLKTTKKKKKPLSQNIPTKKDWTIEEAQEALMTEKTYNKKTKNALIIKFPDQELSKEIVGKFHEAIENVHFQQPCTPRFCFVTLQEKADPEEVIVELNKQKFGNGLLTVEYKKDREDEQAVNPSDIDPLTLYVGNLAQEITKEDMVSLYPTSRRIDIGYAKKMKFTRYAFVGFRTVADSIKAFKNTYNKEMYNKSLIVRFRRLHGTVGMPGESKLQNPPKSREIPVETEQNAIERVPESTCTSETALSRTTSPPHNSPGGSWEESSFDATDTTSLDRVKQEHLDINSDDESDAVRDEYRPAFPPGAVGNYLFALPPLVKAEVKTETEVELVDAKGRVIDRESMSSRRSSPLDVELHGKEQWSKAVIKMEVNNYSPSKVKEEPDVYFNDDLYEDYDYEDDAPYYSTVSRSRTDFDSLYGSMSYSSRFETFKRPGNF